MVRARPGHLLNPSDPTGDDRSWIAQAWLGIVRRSLGLARRRCHLPTVAAGQITVSGPEVLKPLATLNAGKPYPQQIKPFNFILSCHVAPFGHPVGADPEHFHLIAPYEKRPAQMGEVAVDRSVFGEAVPDQRVARRAHATARAREELRRRARRVRVPPRGQVRRCQRRAVRQANHGAVGRRHVTIEWPLHFIGKESNKLEEVEGQSVSDGDVYTEYPDPRRDEWKTMVLPFLRRAPAQAIIDATGMSRRTVQRIRNERNETHSRALVGLLESF